MATEIVDGKLLTIKYVTPNASGVGSGDTKEDGWDLLQATTGAGAGMEIRFINSGSFTADTTARTFANDGTGNQPIVFSGRNAADTAYENAYLSRGSVATTFAGKNIIVRYLDITSSATTSTVIVNDVKSMIYNCRIKNTSTSATGACYALHCTNSITFNNYIENVTPTTSSLVSGALYFNNGICFGNKIVTKFNGVYVLSPCNMYSNIVIGGGVGQGFYMGDYMYLHLFKNNTLYNFNYGIILLADSATTSHTYIINNLFHTISGINNPSDPSSCVALIISKLQSDYHLNCFGNRYYNCDNFMVEDKYDTENLNNNIQCTADPFVYTDVNPSFDINPPDYSLNNITGGGVSCKNISSSAYSWTWNH